ncbi:MAG: hypothetical protein ACREU9_00095 [Gammaproteobacteria bacterium]
MFIRHVTLTTGHVRDSLPGEVSEEAIAVCRGLIEAFIADPVRTAPIPGPPGYSLGGRAASKSCLAATVWAGGPPSVCVATIGVALHSRCGAGLWRELHRWGETPVVTDPERCPPEPWVAAVLNTGIAAHMDATEWLGDFERCLAWAFLRMGDA